MKKQTRLLLASLCLGFLGAAARAHENMSKTPAASKEFEQLKGLLGSWEGTQEGGEAGPVTAQYRMTAGGSAIVETLFPGTPHEMVSVYYDQFGKPAMTHYCMLGNRPNMALMKSDDKSLEFSFHDGAGIDPAKDQHMHGLVISFTDKDHVVEKWACSNKKDHKDVVFKLSRVKKT